MQRYQIVGPKRIAAFVAQIGHESGQLVYAREIWGSTATKLKYEGRTDLGNTVPGDGFKYRGHGLIQITGRANYAACGEALGIYLIHQPELLEQPHRLPVGRLFLDDQRFEYAGRRWRIQRMRPIQRREIVAAIDSVHIISTTAITQTATCETLESGQPASRQIDLAPAGR